MSIVYLLSGKLKSDLHQDMLTVEAKVIVLFSENGALYTIKVESKCYEIYQMRKIYSMNFRFAPRYINRSLNQTLKHDLFISS